MTTATAQIEEVAKEVWYTSTFDKIADAWFTRSEEIIKVRIFLDGGTTSSKTYSMVQFFVMLLSHWKGEPLLFSIISESLPHLKIGAIRDFKKIMSDDLDEKRWNLSSHTYTWENGCQLEFLAGDPGKFSGPRRNGVGFNELNNVNYDVYMNADQRTNMFVVADWNPYSEFWFHEKYLDGDGNIIADEVDPKTGKITRNIYYKGLTYNDMPEDDDGTIVSPSVRSAVEATKETDPNYYRVHALGLTGSLEGLVYPNFRTVKQMPAGEYFYGLDIGFSSDPTALVRNLIIDQDLYSQELLFKPGLTNDMIANELRLLNISGDAPIYIDGNYEKDAVELRNMGFNVIRVQRPEMRIEYRIRRVNQFNQYWTEDSLNAIKEQRNFRFVEDKTLPGQFTYKTSHQWSHCMVAREFGVGSHWTAGIGGTVCKSVNVRIKSHGGRRLAR